MSYINEACSSISDLFTKLGTFLVSTPGWTIPTPAANSFAARKNAAGYDICFAAHWDGATPSNVGLYQWFGAAYNNAVHASAQTADSGNGINTSTNATLATGRHVPITNTPTQYWCFEDDQYFHVVVQVDSDDYVHFGAGQLDKFHDWSGGEYVYGFRQSAVNANTMVYNDCTKLLDGILATSGSTTLSNAQLYAATVHAASLPGQGGSEIWLVSMGDQASGSLGTDRAGNARGHWMGGYRGGPFAKAFGMFRGSNARGLCPMSPIVSYYWRRSPDQIYGPMGQMKDVRMVNIRDFAAAEEITVGSDVWVMFPSARKALVDGNSPVGYSGYQGIAYKKVTT